MNVDVYFSVHLFIILYFYLFSYKKKCLKNYQETMLYDGIFQGMYGSAAIAWWSECNKKLHKDRKWSWANTDLVELGR